MNNQVSKIDNSLMELQSTSSLCAELMKSPFYKKVGAEGIYAIVEMSKSVGVDPRQALNGGLYYAKGKVEMSALMMNQLIRQAGHSITKDKKSDNTICILHGKRADTGDTWVESFSIQEAKTAGIYRNVWISYPKDMVFARALSRLARQLFPDVIKGCYVQGEISGDNSITDTEETSEPTSLTISADRADVLAEKLQFLPEYSKQITTYLERQGIDLVDLTPESADKIESRIEHLINEIDDQNLEVSHG
jgi:hypothetical protein